VIEAILVLAALLCGIGIGLQWNLDGWRRKYVTSLAGAEEEKMRAELALEERDAYRDENADLRAKLNTLLDGAKVDPCLSGRPPKVTND